MKIQRQTKTFAELNAPNFEYDNENWTVTGGNVAINDETRIKQRFNDNTLVIELKIVK